MSLLNDAFVCKIENNCKVVDCALGIKNDFSDEEILNHIERVFKIERAEDGVIIKFLPSTNVVDIMAYQLKILNEKLSPGSNIPNSVLLLIRSLRNSASIPETQTYIVHHTDILENIRDIFHFLLCHSSTSEKCLKVCLQLLVNLVSSNESSARIIFKNFDSIIQECLYKNICIYECSALVYNISRYLHFTSPNIIGKLISISNSEFCNEYILFFIETLISSEHFWQIFKTELIIENKTTLLDFLIVKLVNNKDVEINLLCFKVLSEEFIQSVGYIFQLERETKTNNNTNYVSLILQILASCSSNEKYLNILQRNKDLFINAGVLLINLHNLGKSPDNCFTPISKLSSIGDKTISEHPAFGFKADLIRFIGNMCWGSSEMQNLARTAELIPIILDCCNMDAKNPFIIQWCILAIRNICTGNIENQKIIAGLHQQGTVSTEVLNEMGITLQSDGETSLKIISLNDLKKQSIE